jgi:hypothetical protein
MGSYSNIIVKTAGNVMSDESNCIHHNTIHGMVES